MPPKRLKPLVQQQQQVQQVPPDQQQQVHSALQANQGQHGGGVDVTYGHGGPNIGGMNVGFHQPSHHPHHQHQMHSGVLLTSPTVVDDSFLKPQNMNPNLNPGNQKGPVDHLGMPDGGDGSNSMMAPGGHLMGQQAPPPPMTPPTRKRSRASKNTPASASAGPSGEGVAGTGPDGTPAPKRSRTNTPWTPQEEQRLKTMRDAGNSWSEIAKTFPTRTEGSVKKHWYKDMHYAEFGEDESAALLAAIKKYEANKWKVVGAEVGKPAKACEAYAKEHFGGKPSSLDLIIPQVPPQVVAPHHNMQMNGNGNGNNGNQELHNHIPDQWPSCDFYDA